MDRLDRFSQEFSNTQNLNLSGLSTLRGERNRVGDDHLLEAGLVDPLYGTAGQNRMRAASEHVLCAFLHDRFGGLHQGARRINDIVYNQRISAMDLSYNVYHLRHISLFSAFINDGQVGTQFLGIGARPFSPASVRGDDCQVRKVKFLKVFNHNGRSEKMVHGNIKEPLNLGYMKIHG